MNHTKKVDCLAILLAVCSHYCRNTLTFFGVQLKPVATILCCPKRQSLRCPMVSQTVDGFCPRSFLHGPVRMDLDGLWTYRGWFAGQQSTVGRGFDWSSLPCRLAKPPASKRFRPNCRGGLRVVLILLVLRGWESLVGSGPSDGHPAFLGGSVVLRS